MIVPAQKEPDLAIAGLALIVIFGLLIWHDNPIRSDRPFDPSVMQPQYPHTTGYAYDSWLWQDPFSFDSSGYVQKDQYYIEFSNAENNGAETKKPQWFKHRKKLDLEGDSKNEDSAKNYLCTTQFEEYAKKNHVPKILLSLVNVRPNTIENKEIRTRHRHAVVAGLMEKGYYPSHPDRLNFCASSNTNSNRQFDVRWEHFNNESKENIIVAWVDSNAFKINSENINSLLIPDWYQDWHHTWICAISKINCKNLYIFDWIGAIDTGSKLKFKQNIEVLQPAQLSPTLPEQLVAELKNRDIVKPSEIAIITEQDSNTARNLTRAFKESFGDKKDEITTFSYFKGLDAYQQIIDKQGKNEDYQAARQWDTRLSATDLHNPPVGPAQYDYLHRIARVIRQTHDVIDLEKRVAGIKAVGIFGSDFYDKLLILKALRTEMPNLLVFTTDLDAQMLHPQHWRWTRNLVVASPFDLRLNEKHHQKLFPAFRDSRQTEIFYHTLRILGSGKDSLGNAATNENYPLPDITGAPPLIFEIGRDGPVRLTLRDDSVRLALAGENIKCFDKEYKFNDECSNHSKYSSIQTKKTKKTVEHPINECFDEKYQLKVKCNNPTTETITHSTNPCFDEIKQLKNECLNHIEDFPTETTETTKTTNYDLEQSYLRIILFFGITLTLILIVANFRPHSGTLVIGLLIFSVMILGLALLAIEDVTGEPLSFTNGTSLWPTIFVQMIVFLLTIAFSLKGWFMLESNFASLNRRYFKDRPDLKTRWRDREPKSIRSILKVNQQDDTNNTTETWPFYSLAVFLIGAGSIIYAANDANPEGDITFIVCVALLNVLVIICFWIEYARPLAIKAIIFWAETDSYYQDQQSNLEFSSFKIIIGLLILFVLTYIIFYVAPDHFLSQQTGSEIRSNSIFWPAVIVGTGGIIVFFLWIINSSHPDKTTQAKNTQKFIIFQDHDKSGLWQEYYQYGRLDQILLRVAVMWLFFAIIETILFYLLPPWPSPCRGNSCDWNQLTGIVGFIFTMLLTFFVLDAVRLNYYFIRKLRTKHPLLLDDSVVLNTAGLSPNDIKKFYRERKDNPLETLEKIVTLVAERTLVADRLIYYPLLCIMLMLFARTTYFDNQDFPLSKGITFGAGISLLIFSGFMIRYEAQKLKQAAVMSAENLVGNIDPDGHHCVRKLKEINGGIFQPMLEQPVMRALLLILASVGLFAGEYLMLAGF